MTTTAPYGTWTSPITAEAIAKNAASFAEILIDPVTRIIYHVENRPAENDRSVVVNTETRTAVTPDVKWDFRTGVHGYGGSASIVYDGVIYFSQYSDGRVYRVNDGGIPEAITPDTKNAYRYANFAIHPKSTNLFVCILEDHTIDIPSKVVNTLCVIDTKAGTVKSIISGADFYSCPTFTPDGTKIAWQQWTFPDMSWQGTEIHVADVTVDAGSTGLTIQNDTHIAGKHLKISCVFPLWVSNTLLLFTSDVSGFINPWKYTVGGKAEAIFPKPVDLDFGSPAWDLSTFPYKIIDKDSKYAAFVAVREGRDEIQIVNLEGGANQRIESPYFVIDNIQPLSRLDESFVFTGAQGDTMTAILKCDVSSAGGSHEASFSIIRKGSDPSFPMEIISLPQPKTVKGVKGDVHVVYYAPKNPKYSGSSIPHERPPCIMNVHGGPTGIQQQGLSWYTQYFTSRGWGWIDVNYGGSSGYGRAYIDRLNPDWGILDSSDCISSANAISSAPLDLVDPKRISIRGGSSGGFTVLAALSYNQPLDTFGAGTSSYGISALKPLVTDTHKFESHYMDKLLGGTIDQIPQTYAERSPVNHAGSILSPVLLLQGDDDTIVPKEQSQKIYDAMKADRKKVEYHIYKGEGHGWRKESTMRDALTREIKWYEEVYAIPDKGPW